MKQAFGFIIFLYSISALAQNIDAKRDYYWRKGRDFIDPIVTTFVDFNLKPTKVDSTLKKRGNSDQVGMISNSNGALILFSNGCYISDKNDSIIKNTNRMNSGTIHDLYCPPNGSGFTHQQSMIVLPFPRDTNSFAFFHSNTTLTRDYIADRLLVTKVTKDNQEHFTMRYIDSILIKDSIEAGHLTACRHGNGRDWWIIQPRENSNKYYKMLFSTDEITISTQNIGKSSTAFENYAGQAVFSPDGKKYVRYNFESDVRIFDFDRCTGLLSNPIHIPIQDFADTVWFAGCAISANSRFLYLISTSQIYQLDLETSNIAASKTTVLVYDGSVSPAGTPYDFAHAQIGADGKIYISNTGGRNAMHIIEAPDSAGLSCRAVQRRFKLAKPVSYGMPYFPNFRLGALKGSSCDTLRTNPDTPHLGDYDLKLYPNPVGDHLTIDITLPNYDNIHTEIELLDVAGRRVYRARLSPFTSIHSVLLSNFANGLYFVCLMVDGSPVLTRKFTILH
ncbi:MAG: hypothetical protein RLZZ628_3017 [Bacteroidota bacterium]|jgi:hypothetical protein